MAFKNRSEIQQLVTDRPDAAANEFYRVTNQLKVADELIKKLNSLHKFSDKDDYTKLIFEVRARLANYIDWYHNAERFDDRH